ncbi:MAG: signal peptidase I [Planctomycetota bacterium]|nr:MAG: signal peptidase I [Planctomycetota bacterium]
MTAGKGATEQPPRKITPWGWFRENVEAIIIAVVLALIIRHFAVQAFEIPTGSMAPTLYGDHRPQECPECKWKFSIGASRSGSHRPELPANVICPNCRFDYRPRETFTSGHKILVNKFLYAFSKPKRWDVIVFKYPREPWRDYIKRLVGLSGETIAIKNGDIYINGKILRKDDETQESLWFPVYSMEHAPKNQALIPWRNADAENPQWKIEPNSLVVETADNSTVQFARPDGLKDIDIRNGYNLEEDSDDKRYYNKNEEKTPAADARIAFTVTPSKPGGSLTVKLEEERRKDSLNHVFILKIEGDGGKATGLYRHEQPLTVNEKLTLPVGKATEVVCVNRDDRMQLWINGKKFLEHDYGDGSLSDDDEEVEDAELEFIAQNAAVEISKVTIHRDLYHRGDSHDNSFGPEEIPEGHYFALGDNTVNSTDSRSWGALPEENIVGRAFMVFWKPWEIKLIK